MLAAVLAGIQTIKPIIAKSFQSTKQLEDGPQQTDTLEDLSRQTDENNEQRQQFEGLEDGTFLYNCNLLSKEICGEEKCTIAHESNLNEITTDMQRTADIYATKEVENNDSLNFEATKNQINTDLQNLFCFENDCINYYLGNGIFVAYLLYKYKLGILNNFIKKYRYVIFKCSRTIANYVRKIDEQVHLLYERPDMTDEEKIKLINNSHFFMQC